jgi:hypothetical protein
MNTNHRLKGILIIDTYEIHKTKKKDSNPVTINNSDNGPIFD